MTAIRSAALLTCRSPFLDDSKVYCPLANLYLKAYANVHAPDVEITVLDDEYDGANIDALEPFDAVGISIMTPQRDEALALAREIKRRWPDKTLIAGGPHVRHCVDDLLQHWCYDSLVPFDGERPLVEILTRRARDRVLRHVLTADDAGQGCR